MGSVALELFKFGDAVFNADEFIKSSLPSNSDEAIEAFKANVIAFRSSAVQDLQKTVYRNYKEFSKITKEVVSIEADMSTLKGLLGELRGVQDVVKSLLPKESSI
jgi:exocyst complex component 8